MLTRTPQDLCVQCSKTYGAAGWVFHHGRPDDGSAYWCDRGLLCSPACATAHFKLRVAEGTVPNAPAPEPYNLYLR